MNYTAVIILLILAYLLCSHYYIQIQIRYKNSTNALHRHITNISTSICYPFLRNYTFFLILVKLAK